MRHDRLREYLTNPRDFDGWLKANVFVGSIVAVLVLTMALAALYSGAGSNPDRTFKCRSRQGGAPTNGGHVTEPRR